MHIEIKDLQSGQTHRIEEKGAKLGRDKTRSDLAFADSGISGVHARIFCKEGKWFVEDMKSSNGTFVDDAKIAGAVALQVGTAFKLYHYKLEVAEIEAEDEGGSTAVFSPDAQTRQVVKNDVKKVPPLEPAASETPASEQPTGTTEPHTAPEGKAKPVRASEKLAAANKAASVPAEEPENEEQQKPASAPAAKVDQAAFMTNFNKALAYYLAAIPKLLFNFKGSVDKSISDQQFSAMAPMELIAWAVPPLLLGLIAGQIVGLIAMLVIGHLAIVGFVIGLAVSVVGAAIGAVISGYIFHPVLAWFVRILKGTSDEKSRSNFFVITMTGVALTVAINSLAALFLVIPLPFIGVVPVLLSAAVSLIVLFIDYKWFVFFGVAKWFPILLLVLGGLTILMGLKNAYAVVDGGIAQMKLAHSVHQINAASDGASAQIAEAQKLAAAAQGQAAAALKDGQTAIDAAKAQAGKADVDVAAAIAAAQAAQGSAASGAANKPTPTPLTPAPTAGSPSAAAGDKDLPPPPPPPTVPGASHATAETHAAVETKLDKDGKEDFPTYLAKRKAIDQAIEKNPALLANVEGAAAQYKQLRSEMQKFQAKYAKAKKGNDPDQVFHDAEIYKSTVGLVDSLYRKVVER